MRALFKTVLFMAIGAAIVTLLVCCNNAEPQGTMSNPLGLTVGTAHNGSIEAFGTKYYKFTTASAGTHTISLTNLASDLSWDLFNDAGYTNWMWFCDNFFDSRDEIDQTPSLTAGTTYYLSVDEWEMIAGSFNLLVTYP
jgi:hypothetical protein